MDKFLLAVILVACFMYCLISRKELINLKTNRLKSSKYKVFIIEHQTALKLQIRSLKKQSNKMQLPSSAAILIAATISQMQTQLHTSMQLIWAKYILTMWLQKSWLYAAFLFNINIIFADAISLSLFRIRSDPSIKISDQILSTLWILIFNGEVTLKLVCL